MPRSRRVALGVWVGAAVVLGVLAAGLPPDGFFVGDSGVKLIAVRNAIAHPRRPFDIGVPAIGGVPVPELLDPFFVSHGDHAHAETVAVFPLITAPFLAAFGLRGLIVLPMAGFLAALAALARIARTLDHSSPPAGVIAFAFACCPLLFYGLEFWEHSVAAALAYWGTALLIGTDRGRWRMLVSGLLLGGAILMRPEAIWYVLAVLAASRALASAPPFGALAGAGMGVALPLAAFVGANLLHFHNVLGTHVGGNVAAIGASWLVTRAALIQQWLDPSAWIARLLIATALIAALSDRLARSEKASQVLRLLPLMAAAALAFVAARRGLPRESIWAALPAAVVLLRGWPEETASPHRRAIRFLVLTVVLDLLLVLATAPNDGGGQWGPRYLMLASGPAVLAIWFVLRGLALERRTLARAAAILLVAASLLVQRQAYKELRAAKQYYSRLQQELLADTGTGYVLTDLWWLDQVTAARSPASVFLFAADHERATSAIGLLARAHVASFSIVITHNDRGGEQIAGWLAGTPFRIDAARELAESSLTVFRIDGPSGR